MYTFENRLDSSLCSLAARPVVYFERGLLSMSPLPAVYYLSIGLVAGTELSTRSCLSIGEFSSV